MCNALLEFFLFFFVVFFFFFCFFVVFFFIFFNYRISVHAFHMLPSLVNYHILMYYSKEVLHHHIFSHRHLISNRYNVLFCYFSVIYTLMFLLTPDKTEDRTDPCQGGKKVSD